MTAPARSLKELFLAALEVAPESRSAWLQRECADDAGLRERVGLMLAAHDAPQSLLDRRAGERPIGSPPPEGEATIDQPISEAPGSVVGPYKLLEQIGEGGMGTVWMARQTEPVKRVVALKVIKAGMDSRQVIARFEAERQALALMDHPNIAKVLDARATETGRPYFVMELVRGIPITDYCDQNQLTPRERLELFVTVCQAVQHAHQKGIIHRDIKPTNVLVTQHDDRPVVKVIDFGVAKAMSGHLTDKSLFTGFAQMIGTPLYMSPEQAEMSALGVDTRSDIYSLGVLLYELLTGSTPLSHKRLKDAGFSEILRMIREEEPPKPSTRLAQSTDTLPSISARRHMEPAKLTKLVRGDLDWIVMKTLEKDRSRRYETASAFAADVQRYLKDEPVEACPPSPGYRFRKFARRNKRGLLTAAVVAAAVVLTASVSGVLIWRANQNLHQALENERRGAYLQRIALAEQAWAANNLSGMERLLDACPEDLRGWEWRYLKRLQYGTLSSSPLRHESSVYGVAFSPPDGQYLATATKDGFVRLWQAKTGLERQKWLAHETDATTVSFSPNGRYLATGGWDQTVKLWDVSKVLQGDVHTPLLRLEHAGRVRVWSVAFSPDGQRLASAGGRTADGKGEVKVWDLRSRKETLTLSDFSDSVRRIEFSPDGRRLATTGTGLVQLWDAQTGQEQLSCRGHNNRVEGLAFSPDGRRLASVGGHIAVHPDEEIKVWDAQSGQEILSLRGHVAGLRSVAFSPDGHRLASTGLDQTVKVWDAATGHEVLTLRGHIDNVFCVAFSLDGHQLASGSVDNTVRIWDATPLQHEQAPEQLTLCGHTGAVTDVAFHPVEGRSLVSGGTDGTVRVWDPSSGEELGILHGPPSPHGVKVAYSPDGQRLAAVNGLPGQPVRVWEVATKEEICNFPRHIDQLRCVAFSPSGEHVASAGFDFVVRIWKATTGKEVRVLKDHNWPIWDVAFSPDGRHLASGSSDSTVRVWDWTTGEALPALRPQHAGRVASVAFNRDGKLLASASWDRTVKVWEAASWRLRHDLPHSSAVQCVAFDRNGPRLAWGSTDGTVTVWDGPGTETHTLRGHTSWVQAVAFSPDGQRIAAASLDGTVKIWNAPPEPKAPEADAQAK